MNTLQDLRTELDQLAAQAPDAASVRAEVERRAALATRWRRTGSLIAVAASVVLVAGGAVIAVSALGDRGAGVASSRGGSTGYSGDAAADPGSGAGPGTAGGLVATTRADEGMGGAAATEGMAPPTSPQAKPLVPPKGASTAQTLARGPNSSPAPPHTLVAGAVDDPDADAVAWGTSQRDRTAVLTFALSNVTGENVWIKGISAPALGMTQSTPGPDDLVVIPANSSATIVVDYAVGDCAVLNAARGVDPTVELLFYAEGAWWATTIIIDDDGFLRYVTQSLCR